MILKKNNNKIIFLILLYISLLIGFLLGENSSGGSLKDFNYTYQFILKISDNINSGINEMLKINQYHFPLHYVFIGVLLKFLKKIWVVKLIFLHISLLIPFIFYQCLKFEYKNKTSIFFFSLLIFFSPYYRSSSIWPTTDNTALIFFLLSTYFLLKNNYLNKLSSYLCAIFFFILGILH